MQAYKKVSFEKSSLDTLAQIGTRIPDKRKSLQKQIVYGHGSDLSNFEALWNRGKKKLITQKIVLSLVDIARQKGDRKMLRAFWNSYHCQDEVITSNGRLYGKYCKNRVCSICNGNRKAELIRKLFPLVQTWSDAHFVTLTAKSVPAKSLNRRMKDLDRGLKKIVSRNKKRAQRNTQARLIGFRSIECNFNPKKRTYNPHLHLIVATKEMAEILKSEWLKLCTEKFTNSKAQYAVKVRDKEKCLVEVIKYSTKQFTSPDPNDTNPKKSKYIYTRAIYNILSAMTGIRIFERFGFNLSSHSLKSKGAIETENFLEWKHSAITNDWLNLKGQRLTGYLPSCELTELLASNFNDELA